MATGTALRALSVTGKLLSIIASLVLSAILAIWLGAWLAQGINAGVPSEQMGPRFGMAATLLISSVVLVVAHYRPAPFTQHPVWWSSPALAATSLAWLYVAQSMATSMGV